MSHIFDSLGSSKTNIGNKVKNKTSFTSTKSTSGSPFFLKKNVGDLSSIRILRTPTNYDNNTLRSSSCLPSPRLLSRYRCSIMPTVHIWFSPFFFSFFPVSNPFKSLWLGIGIEFSTLSSFNRFYLLLKNEELNNKLDVEIRILDGILKLLNAITSRDPNQSTTSDAYNPNVNDAISAAHLSQLLNTCKCLFVSHRKIAIYLNDLHKRPVSYDQRNHNVNTDKVCLSNIRVPLSWKYNEFLKATKNSG